MHLEVAKLLKLQEIDGRLEILRRELRSRPRIVEEQDERVIDIRKRHEALDSDHKIKMREMDRLDLDIKSTEAKIAEVRQKLNLVRTNKEFAALNEEIRSLMEDKSGVEDQLLALWEERDDLKKREGDLEQELVEARKILLEEQQRAEQEIEEIRKEAEQLVAERERALAPIDETILEDYQVLFSRYRDRSIVLVEGGVCGGCNMTLSPQVINELRNDAAVVACANCSRILVS